MASDNRNVVQKYLFPPPAPAGDTEISLKMKNMDNFIKMRNALKSDDGTIDNDKFEATLTDMLENVAIEKDGLSESKYTTVKSVTSGFLNIGMLELTVVGIKELVQAGRGAEPFYNVILVIYGIMLVLQAFGILGSAYLGASNFRVIKTKIGYHYLNNAVAVLASTLLILNTVAAALRSDKHHLLSNEQLMELLMKSHNASREAVMKMIS